MPEQLIGFYENMPFEDYAAVDALNGSSLVHMMRSPLNFRWHEDNPQPPTDAMKLGTMIHSAILDPPPRNHSCSLLWHTATRTQELRGRQRLRRRWGKPMG